MSQAEVKKKKEILWFEAMKLSFSSVYVEHEALLAKYLRKYKCLGWYLSAE